MNPTRRHFSSSLYLRTDGTLLLSSGASAIEIKLLPDQLLYLGTDCLRLALELDPKLGERVADALAGTSVLVPVDDSAPETITHAKPT